MNFKFLGGLILLFIALLLQFFFARAGIFINFSFAAIISFAFVFEFWELAFLTLLTVFILNWQPAPSVEILVFALVPIAVHFLHPLFHWQIWLENCIAIVLGFLVLYLAAAPSGFLAHSPAFLLDLAGGLITGALTLFPLYRWQ